MSPFPDPEQHNSNRPLSQSRKEFSSRLRKSDDWMALLMVFGVLGGAVGWFFAGGLFSPNEETVTQTSNDNFLSVESLSSESIYSSGPIEVPEPHVPDSEGITALPVIRSALSFTDVPEDYWAKPYIDALTARGVLNGLPNGTYAPDRPMTRAELAVQVANAFEIEPVRTKNPFKDVPDTYWGKLAIDEAVSTGFMAGYPDDVFRPSQTVSRLETVVSLATGLSLSQTPSSEKLLEQYLDQSAIPVWAQSKVAAAIAVDILTPSALPKEQLRPQDPATRAEVAVLIYKALAYMGKVQPIE